MLQLNIQKQPRVLPREKMIWEIRGKENCYYLLAYTAHRHVLIEEMPSVKHG